MARKSAFKDRSGFFRKVGLFLRRTIDNPSYAIYRFKWNYYPRFGITTKFPLHLDIENTNMCNLRCIMCPHGNPTSEFKNTLGVMSFDMYKRIIDEGAEKGLYSIKLNWRGEPLLHRDVIEMVRYAKDKGIVDVMFNSNGQLLTKELSHQLIDAGLDMIIFSVDGIDPETYCKIRRGGNYKKLLNNIKNLVIARKKAGSKKPYIRMQMVLMDVNKKELERFKKFWETKVDSITTQDYTTRHEGESLLTGEKEEVSTGRRPCPQIWQRLVITWDGKGIMCCRDWESENVIGSLSKNNSIEAIWNSKKLTKIRDIHRKKRLEKIPVCDKCAYKESYEWR